jgi:hypothetical protein
VTVRPVLIASDLTAEGVEARRYVIDGEEVVALLHDGRLLRVIREDSDAVLAWGDFGDAPAPTQGRALTQISGTFRKFAGG